MIDAQQISGTVREKLRSLFLDELMADEGWHAYVDLLLANISYENLLLLRTNGFPAAFNFPAQVFTNGVNAPTNAAEEYLEDTFTRVQGPDGLVGFQYAPSNSRKLDFSEIAVRPVNIERITIHNPLTGDIQEWVAGYGPDFITFDSSLITTFYVAEDIVIGDAPSFDLVPYYIPEELDPVAINDAVYAEQAYMQLFGAPTSPQALFGMLARMLRGHDLRVWYEFAGDTGIHRWSYPDYVKFHDIKVNPADGPTVSYVSMWTDAPVPLDALRDRFGYGDNLSEIVGYDKQYLVTKNNAPREVLTPLMADDPAILDELISVAPNTADFGQRGGDKNVTLTTGDMATTDVYPIYDGSSADPSFVLVATGENGEPFYLADPASVAEDPVYGITKFYAMLSMARGGILKKIHLEVGSISEVPNSIADALEAALNNAAKPGVTGDQAFFFPNHKDTIIFGDSYLAGAYLEASTDKISFPQRGGSEPLQIITRPGSLVWDAKDASPTIVIGNQMWSELLTEHGGTEVDGRWYYTWQQAEAAAQAIGNGWHLPQAADWRNLVSMNSWVNSIDIGIKGQQANSDLIYWDTTEKGVVIHETLFLPAYGYLSGGKSNYTGRRGYYWTRQPLNITLGGAMSFERYTFTVPRNLPTVPTELYSVILVKDL